MSLPSLKFFLFLKFFAIVLSWLKFYLLLQFSETAPLYLKSFMCLQFLKVCPIMQLTVVLFLQSLQLPPCPGACPVSLTTPTPSRSRT